MSEILARCTWLSGGDPNTFAMISRPEIESLPVWDIVSQVMDRYLPTKTVGKMICLSRMTPGQVIEPHIDRHDAKCPHRIHVPLQTNESVVFVEEKTALHMRVGHAYEINPTKQHSVVNGGTTDRVHLFWNAVDKNS